eukprot:CAMPEP_0196599384 /NCGR_PEP_ID=MMETSP1081-20130531/94829_1 /TAXON_ID=36882 /ORGANISM="Pyramimonas amylifera, Strain CCMP720" /LENGTH=429 /DNA_ID=CAMNT_0041925151 /DNA_START=553 /DNA_END=1842 /DNA_ORIENTATION=+
MASEPGNFFAANKLFGIIQGNTIEPKLLYEIKPGVPARPGIVSTVRGMGDTLYSWIHYHLASGFCRLYIYFDDPEEAVSFKSDAPDLASDLRVVIVSCDSEYRDSCRLLGHWHRLGKFIEEEVQARQELNAQHALGQAVADGVTWLLHIDADELFYSPDCSVVQHFTDLSRDGVSVMNYVNHEGVPERDNVGNFFEQVTLFRQNLSEFPQYVPSKRPTPGASPELLTPEQTALRTAIEFWVRRSATRQYFVGYENGKSAVAVIESAFPLSVHEWSPPTKGLLKRGCHNIRQLDSGGCLHYRKDSACILHFISCGFDWWWRKYSLLGKFPCAWFGGAVPIPPSFHLASRDSVSACDPQQAQAFYRAQVVLDDPTQIQEQVVARVLKRITRPQQIILQRHKAQGRSKISAAGEKMLREECRPGGECLQVVS